MRHVLVSIFTRHLAGSVRAREAAIAGLILLIAGLGLPAVGWAQEASSAAAVAYRDVPVIGSRNLIWVVAQVHLLFGGFVLGVPIFAWICEIIAVRTRDPRYDKLAKEFTNLLTATFEMTAMLGALL